MSLCFSQEEIVCGLRDCIEQHWLEDDFVVLKVDLKNAFNMVSRQAVLTECAVWANWCYGHHPFLWHPLGCLTSELDVQQGDPLDPLLFSLVLNILVSAISTRDDCAGLNFHAWYMDDGALAGPRSSVMNVLALLQELGPPLSLHVNIPLQLYDQDVRRCFSSCTAVDTSDAAWRQAILGLKRIFQHIGHLHVQSAVRNLPTADRARLFSVSTPHASSWLSVLPSQGLGLHLDAPVHQVAIKWWLGMGTSQGSQCALCPDNALDPLGHHAITCKHGGDVVARHNTLRDVLAETCHRAHLGIQVEAGNDLTADHCHTHPADLLLTNWTTGKTAAFDISVTSPLNTQTLMEAGVSAGSAALASEGRKAQGQ
eukprot:Em0019g800a